MHCKYPPPLVVFACVCVLSCSDTVASNICKDRSPSAVAAALGVGFEQKPPHRKDKPNVIVIIADDLGYADTSAYGGEVPTPNIDQLAASGAQFTAGYAASAICSPSRAGLITGKQPNTLGYARNILEEEYNDHTLGLPLSEKTIANYFKQAGYVTGQIGKWHLGEGEQHQPLNRGFDEYFRIYHHWGGAGFHDYYPETYLKKLRHNLAQDMPSLMESCDNQDKYLTDVEGLEAVSFVLRHRDRPFLLYFSLSAPHTPIQPRQESLTSRLAYYRFPGYLRNVFNRPKRHYLRMVMQMDEAIGHVVDAIDALGLAQNTLIWFISDNGGWWKMANNGVLRGNKGSLYEGGVRVPFIVRWPGVIAPAVHDWPVTALDILPTSLAASGIQAQLSTSTLSGKNLLPYLTQENPPAASPRDLYWRMEHRGEHRDLSVTALRSGDWKLISKATGSVPTRWELYHLQQDISESDNLAAQAPETLHSLQEKMTAWIGTLPAARW